MFQRIQPILSILKPYQKNVLLNIFSNILASVFNLLSVVMFMPVLEMIFTQNLSTEKLTEYASFSAENLNLSSSTLKNYIYRFLSEYILSYPDLIQGKVMALFLICGLVILSFVLKNFFSYWAIYLMLYVRFHLIEDFRQKLYGKVLKLDIAYFSDQKRGDLLSRFTSDIYEVNAVGMQILEAYFKDLLGVIFTLVFLFNIHAQLTLFVLLFLPISGFLITRLGKNLKKNNVEVQQKGSDIISTLDESLSGIKIIKIFTAEKTMKARFKRIQAAYSSKVIAAERRREIASPFSEVSGIFVVCIIIIYGGKLVFQGEIGGSEFILFIGLFYNLINHIKGFSQSFFITRKGMASLQRLQEIQHQEVQIQTIPPIHSPAHFAQKLCLENVYFSYNDTQNVLENISFEVPKGKTIALVGSSGSGKSTIANLIPRFYDVTEGKILLDGINIQHIPVEEWREKIGLVSQESILFNDTVYHNIAFGKPSATPEEVKAAAQIAHAHDFISHLDKGYDTLIGDAGNKLSGGQKQRIAIARAILKDPEILILDEATSALDTESERLVQDALDKLMKNRTSIVIAHRLSTIIHADQILVMQKGKIIERGTHSQLLVENGLYARLNQLQNSENQ